MVAAGRRRHIVDNIVPFPLSEGTALRILRDAAEDTQRVVNTIPYQPNQVWIEVVSYRQAILCMKEGRIVDGPERDDQGNWVCVVERLCGDSYVQVTVAIDPSDNRVYILSVT